MTSIDVLPLELLLEVIAPLERLDIARLSLCTPRLEWMLGDTVWGKTNEHRNDLMNFALFHVDFELIKAAVARGASVCSIQANIFDAKRIAQALSRGIPMCGIPGPVAAIDNKLPQLERLDLITQSQDHGSLEETIDDAEISKRWTKYFIGRLLSGRAKHELFLECLEAGQTNVNKLIVTYGDLAYVIDMCSRNPLSIVRQMLRNGSDPNRIDVERSTTPLRAALSQEYKGIFNALLKAGADINEGVSRHGMIVQRPGIGSKPCLFLAVDCILYGRNMDFLNWCFRSGANVNLLSNDCSCIDVIRDGMKRADITGMTALVYYLTSLPFTGSWKLRPRPVDVVKCFYQNGADLNPYRPGQGSTSVWRKDSHTWLIDTLKRNCGQDLRADWNFIAVMKFLAEHEGTYGTLKKYLKWAACQRIRDKMKPEDLKEKAEAEVVEKEIEELNEQGEDHTWSL